MALVRILVDGYSLLHNWPEQAAGKPRHSAAARDALTRVLARYADAIGTPITVVFDGAAARRGTPGIESTPELEILYSSSGQTADDLIERAAHRLQTYGDVLVVTDDNAERDMVISLGGSASSCANFIRDIETALGEFERGLKHYNQRERRKFQRAREL